MPTPRIEIHIPPNRLALSPGEWLSIIGASGSGKTKLLKMLAGLEPAPEASITIGDREVSRLAPRDRGIGLVYANPVLYPHMTVYANIAFGLKLAKTDPAELDRRVRDAARMLNLSGLLDRNPHGLTPALRPLVAIGRALARKPELLLLDEPLGSLDGANRAELFVALQDLRSRLAISAVYATRNQVEAERIANRELTLDEGRFL